MNTVLFNAIFEAAVDGDITTEQRDAMLEILATEGVFSNPIKKFKAKIEEIKNGKPDEYSDIPEVKKYIDKNSKTLTEVANILEKEPSELTSNMVKTMIGSLTVIIAGIGLSVLFPAAGLGGMMIGYLGAMVSLITNGLRVVDDVLTHAELLKIRSALKKTLAIKNLPNEYTKKIKKMITQIDDAETSMRVGTNKVSVTKESVSFDEIFSDMMF